MSPEVRLILHREAISQLGSYTVTDNSDAMPSIEFRKGFNEALDEIQANRKLLMGWLEALSQDTQSMMEDLLIRDMLEFYIDDQGGLRTYINLNDTFGYACADAEGINIEEVPVFHKIFMKYGWDGAVAWASKKRNAMPIPPLITDKFKTALEELN